MKIRDLALISIVSSVVLASCGGNNEKTTPASNGSGSNSNTTSGIGGPSSVPNPVDGPNAVNIAGDYTYNFKSSVNGVNCNPGTKRFRWLADFCHALASDDANRDPHTGEVCNSVDRESEFEEKCSPNGYLWPVVMTPPTDPNFPPVFTPTPRPTATPFLPPLPPAPPIDNRPQVFKDLESYGINVSVDRNPTSSPSQRPFNERLNNFLPELGARAGMITIRSADIQNLVLSTYTKYNESAKTLTLDVDLSDQDLMRYFSYFDRIRKVELITKVQIDLGIAEYGNSGNGDVLGAFASNVAFIETKTGQLSISYPLVLEVTSDVSTSFSLMNHVLYVDRTRFQDSLNAFVTTYLFAQPAFSFAFDHHLEIMGNLDLNDRKNTDLFKMLSSQLLSLENAFNTFFNLNKLTQIDVSTGVNYPSYDARTKTLHLATLTNVDSNIDVTEALAYQLAEEQSFGFEFKNDFDQLGTNYLKVIARLKLNASMIYAKRNAVRAIRLTQTSGFSSGTLSIGYAETDDNFSTLLQKIR